MTFGIHYTGAGDSWFTGVNADRRACFHGRDQAKRFASEAEATSALSEIPECVRKWFCVETWEAKS